MSKPEQIWQFLTEAKSHSADHSRQEQIVKLMLVVMGSTLSIFTLIVMFAVMLTGLPEFIISIMLTMLFFIVVGWVLADHGMTGLGRFIPFALIFFLGIYGSFDNGLISTGLLFYVLAILMAAILFGSTAQWLVMVASLVIHFSIVWIRYMPPLDQLTMVAISTTGAFTGISLLFSYYTHQLQEALLLASANSKKLEQKTADLFKAYIELQEEIAEHNKAKDALQSTNRLLEITYDTIPDPIIWIDPEWKIVSCNNQVQRVFDYSPDELEGQVVDQFFFEGWKTESELEAMLCVLDERGYLEQTDISLKRKGGQKFQGSLSIGVIRDDSGQVLGYVSALRDMSEQIQAHKEIQRRTAQLEALRETGLELAAQLDLEDLFKSIVVRAIELMNADAGGIYLYRRELDLLERSFSIGDCVPTVGAKRERGQGLSGTVWMNAAPVHVSDYNTWPGRMYNDRKIVPKGVVGVPIQWGDEFLGVLVVSTLPTTQREFSPVDVETLTLFSTQVAIAVNNARLYRSIERWAKHLLTLNRTAWAAGSTLDLDELLETVYNEISQIFTVESFFIALYDLQASILDFRLAIERGNRICLESQPLGVGLTSQVITQGQAILIHDLENEPNYRKKAAFAGEVVPASWLATPIKIGRRVLGVINIQSTQAFAYNDEDLMLFSTIADQVGIAIEKVRLYEETDRLLVFNENIVQGIQEGIVISDSEGRLTFLNPAAGRILDYNTEELIGQPFISLIHPDQAFSMEKIKKELEEGKVKQFEIEMVRKDGLGLVALISSRPLFNRETGEYEGALSAFIDISDRVKAEKQRDAAIRDLQHRLDLEKVISSISSQFIRSNDIDKTINETLAEAGKIAGANRAYLYKINLDNDIANSTHEWCSEGIPSRRGVYRDLSLRRYSWGINRLLIDKVLNIRDISELTDEAAEERQFLAENHIVSILGLPIHAGEEMIGFIGFNNALPYVWSEENVTLLRIISELIGTALEKDKADKDRAALLSQIQEQANQIKQTIESVPEGVLLLGPDREIMIENRTAREILTNLGVQELIPVDLGGKGALGNSRVFNLDELLGEKEEGWQEIRSGRYIFEVFVRPITTKPDTGGWILVLRDVTEERDMRARIQQRDRLAAVGQLAAGIAHDFNNIMAVILLYAQLSVQEEYLPTKVGERLDIVIEQSQRATELINQILDFSRSAILVRKPIDLAPLLKEQVKLIKRTLPETIDVEFLLEDGQYQVDADLTRIQQIILNLAVNARDAMPDGGKLRISLSHVLNGDLVTCVTCGSLSIGEWVKLTVADSGVGISENDLPYIFDPFFTTKEPGKGSGLGLAQVYGIVKQHNGHIDVSTNLGNGSEFVIYLPALPATIITRQERDSTVFPYGAGQTILVVEDEEAVRQALVFGLRELSYDPLEACDGFEALEILEKEKDEIRLVLSDIVMPEMGGIQLAIVVKQLYPDIGVILITGYPRDKVSKEIESAGVLALLEKPVNLGKLARTVAEVLK